MYSPPFPANHPNKSHSKANENKRKKNGIWEVKLKLQLKNGMCLAAVAATTVTTVR